MGRSAKPRRRRASASALNYERKAGRKGPRRNKSNSSEVSASGCAIGLGIAGLIVLLATLDMLWGDDTWQWAAEGWPGGAYGFAVLVGTGGPCLVVLSALGLRHMKWKSWRAHPVRTLTNTMVGALAMAALVPWASLVYNAQDTGKWGRGAASSPSWVFSNYPWLWAVFGHHLCDRLAVRCLLSPPQASS
jgi:multisubunit Na+/H+ antiporter MnhB subunit